MARRKTYISRRSSLKTRSVSYKIGELVLDRDELATVAFRVAAGLAEDLKENISLGKDLRGRRHVPRPDTMRLRRHDAKGPPRNPRTTRYQDRYKHSGRPKGVSSKFGVETGYLARGIQAVQAGKRAKSQASIRLPKGRGTVPRLWNNRKAMGVRGRVEAWGVKAPLAKKLLRKHQKALLKAKA